MRKFGLAGLALAVMMSAGVARAGDWSGVYWGGSAGIRQTDSKVSIVSEQQIFAPAGFVQDNFPGCFTNTIPCAASGKLDQSALRIGTYLGANWQFSPHWLVGIEGDFGWADQTSRASGFSYDLSVLPSAPDSFTLNTTWDASARARLGFLVTPSVLLYGTGGVAFQQAKVASDCSPISCVPLQSEIVETSKLFTGWTAGFGFEAKTVPTSPWIWRGEYRFADFGKTRFTDMRPCPIPGPATCGQETSTNVTYDLSLVTHTITFGFAYQFH